MTPSLRVGDFMFMSSSQPPYLTFTEAVRPLGIRLDRSEMEFLTLTPFFSNPLNVLTLLPFIQAKC